MNKTKLLPANEDPRNPSYHFLNLVNEDIENSELFNSYIEKSTRRCTGFRPSLTSGSALPTITLIA